MTRVPPRLLTLVPLLALFLAACDPSQPEQVKQVEPLARPAKIVALTVNGASLQRTYPGTLEAREEAALAFRVSGQLSELPALAGERVRQGDLLARLDPADYKNTLAERQARFELASTQLQQARTLLKKNFSSQTKFDQANAELKSARAARQQARDNLRYTELKAPFDGVIARVDIENHQPVQAQNTVVHLRSDDQLTIRFSVPESMLAQLKQVEDPQVINAFCGKVRFSMHQDKAFRACHREHESVPDPLTRNYSAWFVLDPIKEFVVLPGMTASISLDFSMFLAEQVERAVFAPVEAVFSEQGKQWVWRVNDDMTVQREAVTVGRIAGEQIEITSGINPDSRIVAAGVAFVREGMRVKPVVKQRGL